MATYWTSFAATGNPNGDLSQFGGWPPHPSTARNCTTTQPHVVWPMFKVGSADAESAEYIMLNECNVTVQPAVSYRGEQCEFWAKLCADPALGLVAACAFNRTGPFPHPP